MSAAPADRSYSEAERAQILTQELAFLTQPTSYTGTVGPGGTVSLGARGPKIKQRGKLSAVVWTGMDYAHPAYIALHAFFTVMTCGLYLPFWWWGLRKKPQVYTVAVDEHGNITRTQHEISLARDLSGPTYPALGGACRDDLVALASHAAHQCFPGASPHRAG
jgi:hypothetical protein